MGSAESTLPSMEDSIAGSSPNQTENQRNHNSRTHREAHTTTLAQSDLADDPWWWEIENENLLLDRVPNITTESNAETVAGVTLSDDFNTLLKIGENVNLTLNAENSDNHNSNNENNINSDISSTTEISLNTENMDSTHSNNDKTATTPLSTELSQNTEASPSITTTQKQTKITSKEDNDQESIAAAVTRTQTLDEFKEELRLKRIARQTAIQELRDEITTLRKQLNAEQALTRRLRHRDTETDETLQEEPLRNSERKTSLNVAGVAESTATVVDEDDENVCSRSRHANIELANAQLSLQLATSENLTLRTELTVTQKQVGTLKEVVACCKQMMAMKEEQCKQLKTKLSEIEESFGEREMKIMSDNLRQEYERQLVNIRQLRQLYEERQRIAAAEHENLQRLISIKRDELVAEQERTKSFEERNQTLLKEVETANNELAALREECNEHKFEKKALKEEMGVVNTLFSQMLMGFNGKNNLDIDRLATMLEENRTLLNDMATKEANCSDGATLPKLLFELVEQAAVANKTTEYPTTNDTQSYRDDCDDEDHGDVNKEDETEADEADVVDEAASSSIMSSANKDVVGKNDKCSDAHTEAEEVDVNDDASYAMQVVEGGGGVVDNTNASVVANDNEDNVNKQSYNNNNNSNENIISKNNGSSSTITNNSKKHHQRKTAACNNNKTKMPFTNSNSTTNDPTSSTTSTYNLHEPEVMGQVASTQEIIGNLPKVWKVLMELLSHHKIERVQFEEHGASEDCYKSVETPNGPKAELSVSKTYIKLKDLILEKKSLVKETNRLKTLNCHLDYRLNEQEKRLSAVSLELTKTWHLVGKMQRQHRQLHTQEQILRYQLQQKRRLLSELKDELEYCRRKWAAARAKNDESQEQCNDLRREFAKRKLEDANNSAESGYSDSSSGPASDEEVRTVRAAVGVAEGIAQAEGERSNLREMFEHSRKIKRMQSSSPGRAMAACGGKQASGKVVVMRRNSAPPTCGWGGDDEEDDEEEKENAEKMPDGRTKMTGAIPKLMARNSRSKQRLKEELEAENSAEVETENAATSGFSVSPTDRAERIQRLEQQCKSLIQQVLETSDNRERLEIQLCRFQDEIAPVQYAIPLNEFITKKRLERMTRASSAPASPAGSLTAREEEYTRKRSERLGRLEEESRQLISRIKRTSDRGHYLRCSLDRLHRARGVEGNMSREGSFESNTEEEVVIEETDLQDDKKPDNSTEDEVDDQNSPLTSAEEAYTRRRSERLKRLEDESKQLLAKLSKNNQRGSQLSGKLDDLHEQHGSNDDEVASTSANADYDALSTSPTIEKRIENIERISSNRDERLRILEEEGNQLISRLSNTSERGTRMINRIAEREQNRAARLAESASKENTSREATPTITEAVGITNEENASSTRENIPSSEENMPSTAEIFTTEENCLLTETNLPSPQEKITSSKENILSKEKNIQSTQENVPSTIENIPSTLENVPESGAPLLPILKTVACSSIVSEELAECVTVTTTSSQIAGATQQLEQKLDQETNQKADQRVEQGAVPKTKPQAQLSVASKTKSKTTAMPKAPAPRRSCSSETLEEMVMRLRSLPFPDEDKTKGTEAQPEKKSDEEKDS